MCGCARPGRAQENCLARTGFRAIFRPQARQGIPRKVAPQVLPRSVESVSHPPRRPSEYVESQSRRADRTTDFFPDMPAVPKSSAASKATKVTKKKTAADLRKRVAIIIW